MRIVKRLTYTLSSQIRCYWLSTACEMDGEIDQRSVIGGHVQSSLKIKKGLWLIKTNSGAGGLMNLFVAHS